MSLVIFKEEKITENFLSKYITTPSLFPVSYSLLQLR